MNLQVKKLKVDISATLSPVPIITPKAETNYSLTQLRERTKKTYFEI